MALLPTPDRSRTPPYVPEEGGEQVHDPLKLAAASSKIVQQGFNLILGLFGATNKEKYYKKLALHIEQLYGLGLEDLAITFQELGLQVTQMDMQAQMQGWEQEFAIARLKEDVRQRNIDRAVQRDMTLAGLRQSRAQLAAAMDVAEESLARAKQSWAVRRGLFDAAEARALGLATGEEERQVDLLARERRRHDAKLIVEAGASGLINRDLDRIRGEQAGVYNQETAWAQESAAARRQEIRESNALKRMDAQESLDAEEMQRDQATANYAASVQYLKDVEGIQVLTEFELNELGVPEKGNLQIGDIDLDYLEQQTGTPPTEENPEGTPATDEGQDEPGRLDDPEEPGGPVIPPNPLPPPPADPSQGTIREQIMANPIYRSYVQAVAKVQNAMIRYGPTRLSGSFAVLVQEALFLEQQLKSTFGDDFEYADQGQGQDWKGGALGILEEKHGMDRKDVKWDDSTLPAERALRDAGAESDPTWWDDPSLVYQANRLTQGLEGEKLDRWADVDYADKGLGARGRLERSASFYQVPGG